MYIDAYGLTMARILPFWFILVLMGMTALCFVKLYKPDLRLLRAAAGLFIAMYIALSLPNLEAVIAKSVLSKAEAKGTVTEADANFLRYTLSSDARGVLMESPLKYEIYYDVDPEDLD